MAAKKKSSPRVVYVAPSAPEPTTHTITSKTAVPIGLAVIVAIFVANLLGSYLISKTKVEAKIDDIDGLKPIVQDVPPLKAKVGSIDEKVSGLQTWTQNLGQKLDQRSDALNAKIDAQAATTGQKLDQQKDAIADQKAQNEKILGAINVLAEKVGKPGK